MNRRKFVQWLSASAAVGAVGGCAAPDAATRAGDGKAGRVIVIGGGYGGATAAKYVKLWNPAIDVVLVEQNPVFISCPLSNRVLAGTMSLQDLTRDY
ncbi:MAG: flavocytochrome C, partial [Burkholderiales bacterium]|nr:flavocytochrome C [Burkholderiales bacterium]